MKYVKLTINIKEANKNLKYNKKTLKNIYAIKYLQRKIINQCKPLI